MRESLKVRCGACGHINMWHRRLRSGGGYCIKCSNRSYTEEHHLFVEPVKEEGKRRQGLPEREE